MFAHKEISHKIHGPTRSENARYLLVWVYRERCEHILYAFWASYTVSMLILRRESFSSSANTPSCVLISQNVAHASDSKSYVCVMRTWLRFATERKKKNEAGISTRAFPLESPSNKKSQREVPEKVGQSSIWQMVW